MERMPIPTLETLSRKQQPDSPKSAEPVNPGLFSLSHRAAKSGKRAVDHCIPPRHALRTCTMWGQVLVSSCSVGYFHLIVLMYLRNGSLMSVLFLVRSLRPPMSENRCIPICGTPIYQWYPILNQIRRVSQLIFPKSYSNGQAGYIEPRCPPVAAL